MNEQGQYKNRLAQEKSPYLQQHAHNPVDWFPWGQEAFDKASSEDKPLFLSIGYSTCHWCHVMAHESFEDPEVAELINGYFVPVKVDREERPDIDAVYMLACRIATGGGGWPLTVLITPDKEPFLAATYIPRDGKFPGSGLLELIPHIGNLWKEQRQKINDAASELTKALQEEGRENTGPVPDRDILRLATESFQQNFDREHGGFGNAPKFPSPHVLLFLLRMARRGEEKDCLHMVEKTLDTMRRGGMFDHLGYGFHRYSTDKQWLVPHFEKMLYDQAMLALAYLEAYQVTGTDTHASTAKEIFNYVLRDLHSPEGVFYSGEDADSEGVEGKFYLWQVSDIRDNLPAREAEVFIHAYNLEKKGNFPDEATKQLTGTNIPHRLSGSDATLAGDMGISRKEIRELLSSSRERLYNIREQRTRPQLDDKVLTDWNGLMIAALAYGGRILDNTAYIQHAENAANFILDNMLDSNNHLLHRYKDGQAGIQGFIDDHAFFTWGLLELYAATDKEFYLQKSIAITGTFLDQFRDVDQGGLYMTGKDSETLLFRPKESFDGAIPSGNSVALNVMADLLASGENGELKRSTKELIQAFSALIRNYPTGFAHFLCGLDKAYDFL